MIVWTIQVKDLFGQWYTYRNEFGTEAIVYAGTEGKAMKMAVERFRELAGRQFRLIGSW
jgi:hypothetical protein